MNPEELPGRRDIPVSISCRCRDKDVPPTGKTEACRSRSPDLDPFGIGRSRTTVVGPMRFPSRAKFMNTLN